MPPSDPFSRLARFLGDWGSPLFLLAVLFTTYEVVMRYVFNAPTVWVHEITIALSATAFIISGGYALQRREHIRITLVYDALGPRVRRALDVVNSLLSSYFLAALGFGAASQAGKSLAVGETTGTASNLPIPEVLKTFLACGALLMLAQSLAHLWRHLRGRR